MKDPFKLQAGASKKELIDRYNELLAAYEQKVAEAKDSERARSGGARHEDRAALSAAKEATVRGVIDTLGQLRSQLGDTLNDLTARMSSQAERLEQLGRAIALSEQRLTELHDIEAAADTLEKLTTAYAERKQAAEAEFAARVSEMETTFAERQAALEKEIQVARAAAKDEQDRARREEAEVRAAQKKERAREETEYVYERDRARKLEEHAYQEKVAAQEKELRERREAAEKDLTAREAAVAAHEAELDELRQQVAAFPKSLEKAVADARKDAAQEVARDADQKAKLIAVERDWEKKVAAQKIAHLEETIADQRQKVEALRDEVAKAQVQVHDIAEKAIEGASHSAAFRSVNEIALEQARRPARRGEPKGDE